MSFAQLNDGLALQISLSSPTLTTNEGSTNEYKNQLAVFLHPWSWLGGSMNDYVLHLLEDPFLSHGYHVLRFNSRGVGKSSGRSSFTGMREGEDLQELVSWAANQIGNVEHIVLMGYSHGSLIASLHPPTTRSDPPIPIHYILLSYPLSPRPLLTFFKSSTYSDSLTTLLSTSLSRTLIVYGNDDQFTSASKYHSWVESLRSTVDSTRLLVVEIDGGDHFWHGENGDQLCSAIENWLKGIKRNTVSD